MADKVTHGEGASTGGTLQQYIGYPGTINDTLANKDLFKRDLEEKFVVATLTPKKQEINKDANIYNPVDAWGDYKTDLQKNCGISVGSGVSGCVKVVISQFPPVTETYENEYGDSEILKEANMVGGKAAEIMQLAGFHNAQEFKQALDNNDNSAVRAMGKLAGIWTGVSDKLKEYGNEKGGPLGSLASAAGNVMNSPWSKIGWPQMWKNCRYQSTYELCTRLYCYNVNDAVEYNNNIRAALAALQMFVAPKSEDGVLYTWPYMLQFEIPGSVYMPIAYCSNMTVVKGGDTADFSLTGRPNIIDVRMTIQNAYGICVNMPIAKESLVPARPTLYKDQKALGAGRNIGIQSAAGGGGGGGGGGKNASASVMSNLENQYADKVEQALSPVRAAATDVQKTAAAALESAGKDAAKTAAVSAATAAGTAVASPVGGTAAGAAASYVADQMLG